VKKLKENDMKIINESCPHTFSGRIQCVTIIVGAPTICHGYRPKHTHKFHVASCKLFGTSQYQTHNKTKKKVAKYLAKNAPCIYHQKQKQKNKK
jgi:hypothetical protein